MQLLFADKSPKRLNNPLSMNATPESTRTESDTTCQRFLAQQQGGFVFEHTGAELAERFEMLALKPQRLLCVGWDPKLVDAALKRWPETHLVVVESNRQLAARARSAAARWLRKPRFDVFEAPMAGAELPSAHFDFAVANLTLARSATPDGALSTLAECLQPGAGLLFAMPGPDTLKELRSAWSHDDFAHVAVFPDMHDLGSALSRHGFTESVLNAETLTVQYEQVSRLWQDITHQGARNCEPGRRKTLTGKDRFREMRSRLEGADGKFTVTVELVYVQCWRATSQSRDRNLPEGEVRISLDSLTKR